MGDFADLSGIHVAFQRHSGPMRRRHQHGVMLAPTEPHGYDFVVGSFDYHVRLEGKAWMLDQFLRAVKDADEAHVTTVECASLDEAVLYAVEEAQVA